MVAPRWPHVAAVHVYVANWYDDHYAVARDDGSKRFSPAVLGLNLVQSNVVFGPVHTGMQALQYRMTKARSAPFSSLIYQHGFGAKVASMYGKSIPLPNSRLNHFKISRVLYFRYIYPV